MRKKLVIVLSIGVLAATTLVGCGFMKSEDSDKDTTTEITNQENQALSNETTPVAESKANHDPNTKYTADELINLASGYYTRHYDYTPEMVHVQGISESEVLIHLYNDDDATSYAWYVVDIKTAIGKNKDTGEDVDLNN